MELYRLNNNFFLPEIKKKKRIGISVLLLHEEVGNRLTPLMQFDFASLQEHNGVSFQSVWIPWQVIGKSVIESKVTPGVPAHCGVEVKMKEK